MDTICINVGMSYHKYFAAKNQTVFHSQYVLSRKSVLKKKEYQYAYCYNLIAVDIKSLYTLFCFLKQ